METFIDSNILFTSSIGFQITKTILIDHYSTILYFDGLLNK